LNSKYKKIKEKYLGIKNSLNEVVFFLLGLFLQNLLDERIFFSIFKGFFSIQSKISIQEIFDRIVFVLLVFINFYKKIKSSLLAWKASRLFLD